MRSLGSVLACFLVLMLAGCPKQGPILLPVGSLPGADPDGRTATPSPSPSPTPSPSPSPWWGTSPTPAPVPKNATSVTVMPLALSDSGESLISLEAKEAVLVLSRTGEPASNFSFAFSGASLASSALPRLMQAPPAPAPGCGTFAEPLQAMGTLPERTPAPIRRALTAPPVQGATQSFFVESIPVTATCVYRGDHGAVWLDERDRIRFSDEQLALIGRQFDMVFPEITRHYGPGPAGRSDGYNAGDDRLNFLITQQVPVDYGGFAQPLDFFPDDYTMAVYGKRSNYGKVLYLNSRYGTAPLLNTMIHEYVHIIFYANRLVACSPMSRPLGQDTSYFAEDAGERWLNEGFATLSEYLLAETMQTEPPSGTYRTYLERYLGDPQIYDIANFLQYASGGLGNYGGAFLFSAFAQKRFATETNGREPGFLQAIQAARRTSTLAVTDVLQPAIGKDFSGLYRDFALSLLLDGYHADVPMRYAIPHVDLFAQFGGARTQSMTSGTEPPLPNGVKYVRVRFESGKGSLVVRNAKNLKGTLLLFKPAVTAGVISD